MRKSDFSSAQMGYHKIAHFNLTKSNSLYSKMGYLKLPYSTFLAGAGEKIPGGINFFSREKYFSLAPGNMELNN